MVGAWAMSGRVSTWGGGGGKVWENLPPGGGGGREGMNIYMLYPRVPHLLHPSPPTLRLGVKGSGRRMLRGKALSIRLRI